MLELILIVALVPTLAITLWENMVGRLAPRAWLVYRTTAIVGTPVHEMAHVLACMMFGMRVNEVALYRPHAPSGQLGFVSFSFNPRSWFQVIGLAVQGVAPLLVSGTIAVLALELIRSPGRPDQGMLPLLAWCVELASMTLESLVALATSGLNGALIAAGLLLVCMHGIPSWQDVKVGLRGLLFIAVVISILGLLNEAYWFLGSPFGGTFDEWASFLSGEFERGLWWALHGAVLTVTLAALASTLLLVIPAVIFSVVNAARRPIGA